MDRFTLHLTGLFGGLATGGITNAHGLSDIAATGSSSKGHCLLQGREKSWAMPGGVRIQYNGYDRV